MLDVRLAGDDAPLSIAERPAAQRMLASTDPADAIRRQSRIIVETGARVAPFWPALREAAASDTEIADLLRSYDQARHEGIGGIVDVVANLGGLRRDRTRAKAKDAVFLLTDPSVIYNAQQLGWSPAEMERWYRDCLTALLLG